MKPITDVKSLDGLLTYLRTLEQDAEIMARERMGDDALPSDIDGDAFDCLERLLRQYDIDICELPNWGPMPDDTCEVWSWDKENILVGVGPFSEWRIVERPDIN